MKLIQLNIWFGQLMLNARPFIEREKPDILCLQEVCRGGEMRSPFFQGIEKILPACGLEHVYFSPCMDWQAMGRTIEWGNAILSRYPITQAETVFTHGAYMSGFSFDHDDFNIRNFQRVTLDTPEGKVNIVNHHGYLLRTHRNGDTVTTKATDMIADHIAALNGPVIFTGDLNLGPEAVSLERLNREMKNLCIDNDVKTTRNFAGWNPEEVCDYIFVNDKVRVKKFKVFEDIISDHQALGMEFNV